MDFDASVKDVCTNLLSGANCQNQKLRIYACVGPREAANRLYTLNISRKAMNI